MKRSACILTGLVWLAGGLGLTAVPAAADDPPLIIPRVVVEQRLEMLPEGPLCWNVYRQTLPPDGRAPLSGYLARPPSVAYRLDGQARLDYAGGPSVNVGAGQGYFVGNDNWFAVTNTGNTASSGLTFSLSCEPPPDGAQGITRLANTGPLPGIRPGPAPYMLTLVYAKGVLGAQQESARIRPGPAAWYVLEGEVAQTTAAGTTRARAGDLFVNPVGIPFLNTVVSSTGASFLIAQLFPVGAPTTLLPDLRLPSPLGPSALPRTGHDLAWAGPLGMLMGALLVAAGLGLGRRQTAP